MKRGRTTTKQSSARSRPYKRARKSTGTNRFSVGNYKRFSGLGGTEKKFFDSSLAFAHNTPLVEQIEYQQSLVDGLARGTADNERIGRKISITNVHFKGDVRLISTTGNEDPGEICEPERVRLIWYVDHQMNGQNVAITDMLAAPPSGEYIDAYRNLSNQDRFTVMKDKTYVLNGQIDTSAAPSYVGIKNDAFNVKFSHRFKTPLAVEWSNEDDTGAITNLKNNNIGLIVIWEGATPNFPKMGGGMKGVFRVRYTDS